MGHLTEGLLTLRKLMGDDGIKVKQLNKFKKNLYIGANILAVNQLQGVLALKLREHPTNTLNPT